MSLSKLQSDFARALRQSDAATPSDGTPDFAERFDTYRNNAWRSFATALEQTYPVVQRRVGTEFFRQLAREYRATHPSRSGDLHWVGAAFPSWLASRMAGSGYDWLADLARLEWALAEASVAAAAPAESITVLARFEPESLADLRLELHPSVRCVESPFPVWSVWQANQQDDADPVDLGQGAEQCVIACLSERPVLYRVDSPDYRVLERLALGDTLGEALDAAAADTQTLVRVLAWAFAEQLVAAVVNPSDRA